MFTLKFLESRLVYLDKVDPGFQKSRSDLLAEALVVDPRNPAAKPTNITSYQAMLEQLDRQAQYEVAQGAPSFRARLGRDYIGKLFFKDKINDASRSQLEATIDRIAGQKLRLANAHLETVLDDKLNDLNSESRVKGHDLHFIETKLQVCENVNKSLDEEIRTKEQSAAGGKTSIFRPLSIVGKEIMKREVATLKKRKETLGEIRKEAEEKVKTSLDTTIVAESKQAERYLRDIISAYKPEEIAKIDEMFLEHIEKQGKGGDLMSLLPDIAEAMAGSKGKKAQLKILQNSAKKLAGNVSLWKVLATAGAAGGGASLLSGKFGIASLASGLGIGTAVVGSAYSFGYYKSAQWRRSLISGVMGDKLITNREILDSIDLRTEDVLRAAKYVEKLAPGTKVSVNCYAFTSDQDPKNPTPIPSGIPPPIPLDLKLTLLSVANKIATFRDDATSERYVIDLEETQRIQGSASKPTPILELRTTSGKKHQVKEIKSLIGDKAEVAKGNKIVQAKKDLDAAEKEIVDINQKIDTAEKELNKANDKLKKAKELLHEKGIILGAAMAKDTVTLPLTNILSSHTTAYPALQSYKDAFKAKTDADTEQKGVVTELTRLKGELATQENNKKKAFNILN